MKRVVFFIVIIAVIVAPMFASKQKFDYQGVEKVAVVSTQALQLENAGIVQNGGQNIYSLSVEDYLRQKDLIKDYDGLVFFYSQDTSFEKLKDIWQISWHYKSKMEQMQIVYAFSPLVEDFVFLSGKKVNLQIAWSQDSVMVGLPLILTGF